MRVVAGAHSLAGLGGTETYVVTVADHLQRLGHDVWLYASEHGRASALAEDLGLRLAREDSLPAGADAVLAQDGVAAYELAALLPGTPQVYVAHSDVFDLQLPPQLPGVTAAVVALYDRVERRAAALGWVADVVRLAQPVDVERFKPTRPLRERPRVALALGNYVHGARLELLRAACARAGVELRHHGVHGSGVSERPESVLNEADIVFGKARVILEAMACGRAAYVFDHNGAEGWVTAERYPVLAADNFGGQADPVAVDEERLAADLAAYDPRMGLVNRDLAVTHHGATKHAAALVEVLRGCAPSPAVDPEAPLTEMARLVRMYHRADVQAFALHAETERLGARVHALEAEVEAARAEAREREVEAVQARAALAALKGTLRWRAVQAALRPADRLRGR